MNENELKYVLNDHAGLRRDLVGKAVPLWLNQAYLSSETRIRRTQSEDGGVSAELGFKRRLPTGRNIDVAGAISQDEFETLWEQAGSPLRKQRFPFDDAGLHWDVDFFQDEAGSVTIVVAEVEMPDEMENPSSFPGLIAHRIVYAVPRGDSRFTSRSLADPAKARELARDLGAES